MKKRNLKPTVALDSLGCKLNQAEIQQIAQQLAAAGYRIVPPEEKADIYILNTCTVTHVADSKSRHLLRSARRRNPAAQLIAIGCYAEREPQALTRIEGVELVLGNEQKWRLPELLENDEPLPKTSVKTRPSYSGRRTRAFIKVQDGCRNYCTYCIVPLVRNREFNVPASEVLAQVNEKVSSGFKEIVLTGTEIGNYNGEGVSLNKLLERILAETDIDRLRLSSLQPHHITSELLALWKNPRLCPHFHLSLQSGSDTVLKRMKRRYKTPDYRRAVALIRDSVPDAAITTDVIVGFPGETQAEFKESCEFCEKMRFARIHVFPYSPRPGTAAADMPAQVPEPVKKERVQKMLALAKESAQILQKEYLGKPLEVLWEQQVGGAWSGLTGSYIKVYANSSKDLTNIITPVKLIRIYRDGIWGEISKTITDSISP